MPKKVHMTYLDYASASPTSASVLKAMEPYWTENFHNPSSLSMASKQAKNAIEKSRAKIAKVLGAKPHQIVFTSGATEANNLAIKGVSARNPDLKVLISAVEHESVLEPASELDFALIRVDSQGKIDMDILREKLMKGASVVSIIHVNNELGTIADLREIRVLMDEVAKETGHKTLLHTDAAQSPITCSISVARLGVDLMTLSSSKLYGPRGIGCLYIKDRLSIAPQITGGGQEYGLRSGTESTALIVGFAEALNKISDSRLQNKKHFTKLNTHFRNRLTQKIADSVIISPSKNASEHIVNFRLPGADAEGYVMALDNSGYQIATGAACSAGSDDSSHVLRAIGLSDKEAGECLRVSFGAATSIKDIDGFIDCLSKFHDQNAKKDRREQ